METIIHEYGGWIWVASGLIPWCIISIIQKIQNPEENIGENPAAGQALLIMGVIGPLTFLILAAMVIEYFKHRKTSISFKLKNMPPKDLWEYMYKQNIEKDNKRHWETYKYTNDREDMDEIVDVNTVEIPVVPHHLVFHGACLCCTAQKESLLNCVKCTMGPIKECQIKDMSRD